MNYSVGNVVLSNVFVVFTEWQEYLFFNTEMFGMLKLPGTVNQYWHNTRFERCMPSFRTIPVLKGVCPALEQYQFWKVHAQL